MIPARRLAPRRVPLGTRPRARSVPRLVGAVARDFPQAEVIATENHGRDDRTMFWVRWGRCGGCPRPPEKHTRCRMAIWPMRESACSRPRRASPATSSRTMRQCKRTNEGRGFGKRARQAARRDGRGGRTDAQLLAAALRSEDWSAQNPDARCNRSVIRNRSLRSDLAVGKTIGGRTQRSLFRFGARPVRDRRARNQCRRLDPDRLIKSSNPTTP
jgi:hypothetical protein